MDTKQLDRPPRIQPALPTDTIDVPGPPENKQQQGRQLLAALLPSVTLIGFLITSLLGQSGNLALMLPMGFSMVISTGFSIYLLVLDRRETMRQAVEYRARLLELRRRMEQYANAQREFYYYNYPDPETVMHIASGDQASAHGSRLWERLPTDQDFGEIRLGIGMRESSVRFVGSFKDNLSDQLVQEGQKLVEDSRYVRSLPYTITLRPLQKKRENEVDANIVVGTHALGISGHERALVQGFLQQLIVQYTTFHSPNDASLYFFSAARTRARAQDNETYWGWLKRLPHTNGESDIQGDRTCFDSLHASAKTTSARQIITTRHFWNALQDELEERQQRLKDRDSQRTSNPTLPHLLVIVDLATSDLTLDSILLQAPVRTILSSGQDLGASIVFAALSADQVPPECGGLVELESNPRTGNMIYYAQKGTNTPRFSGKAEILPGIQINSEVLGGKIDFDDVLRHIKIPVTSSDLKRSIKFLELFNTPERVIKLVNELNISQAWSHSMENAEWLKVPVGLTVNGEPRILDISNDGDGVHGIVAGTTGSGKSELLRTLIAGLAVRYDPRVLNFVLVDYKGGAAFAPFQQLPHCVDIVTNLHGRAVERMFDAMQSELERRQKKLADNEVDHIVAYRQKGYHKISEDEDPNKGPFPHLFIIVDEFAEMIKENPDFKIKFESIARLGRALGVTLVLATQRPTGYVTDQMRANMKFRICLRVETGDDSRELLGRSDAAFLPTNIVGRAYVQTGNDSPTLIQVAYTAAKHDEEQQVANEPIRWIDESYSGGTTTPSRTQLDWVVYTMRRLVESKAIPVQRKPWPDPLPNPETHQEIDDQGKTVTRRSPLPLNVRLDTTYFPEEYRSAHSEYVLAPALTEWLSIEQKRPETPTTIWQSSVWMDDRLRLTTSVGIIDNPMNGEQRPLIISLTEGPIVLFGAPGSGKSTFLRTLISGLAATHTPDDLRIYCLDLGGQGLNIIRDLPHVGDIIPLSDPSFDDRIARLVNMLDYEMEARKAAVEEHDSIINHNKKHPTRPIPAILLVIDNVVEIKENEELVAKLGRLIRSGRTYGLYFAFTGTQSGDLPKIYNLFTQRLTLRQADPAEYLNIVGRGAPPFDNLVGRGLIDVSRTPLVFQIAVLVEGDESDVSLYQRLAQVISDYWKGDRPDEVELLPAQISLAKITGEFEDTLQAPSRLFEDFMFPIGMRDKDRRPATLALKDLPHMLVIGSRFSGKTMLLRTITQSLALTFTTAEVGIVLIDFNASPKLIGKDAKWLCDLPHVIEVVARPDQLEHFIEQLELEYNDQCGKTNPLIPNTRHIVIIVDNYLQVAVATGQDRISARLGALAEHYTDRGLHFILAGTNDLVTTSASDVLVRQARDISYGVAMQTTQAVERLDGQLPYGTVVDNPQGRGWIVRLAHPELMQTAMPLTQTEFEQQFTRTKSARLGWRCIRVKHDEPPDDSVLKPFNRSSPPPPLPPGMSSPNS